MRYWDSPEAEANAEYFRKLLDKSEAADSEHLRKVVEALHKEHDGPCDASCRGHFDN